MTFDPFKFCMENDICLDDVVDDIKLEEASVINNNGLRAQVEFLEENGFDEKDFIALKDLP